jgi:hypothetical protein
MGAAIDRWASTARLAMEAASAEHLASGAARISTESEARGTSIVLEAGDQDAAGLRVFASDGQIDVEVIPTGAVFEIWQPSEQERLERFGGALRPSWPAATSRVSNSLPDDACWCPGERQRGHGSG